MAQQAYNADMRENQASLVPIDMLKAIPLFRNLGDEDLQEIASRLRRQLFPKGALVFREGDEGDAMYLVESGQVQVIGQEDNEVIAKMGPGNFVGDIALLLGRSRTADLEVTIDAQLWELKRDDFDALIDTRPSIALEMMRELSRRLIRMRRQKTHAKQRRITAFFGPDQGVLFSEAIYKQIQSPVGLLPLTQSQTSDDLPPTFGVILLDNADLTEAELAENLSHQLDVFRHIIFHLPDLPNALVHKAVDLADTVVCVGPPPNWLIQMSGETELWQEDPVNINLPRIARRLTNGTIGLALSSGGARGLAHIGVMKVLEEAHIPIDMISGSSAGALFGALYAVGWNYERILQYIQDLKSLTNVGNLDFNPRLITGIFKGRKAYREFLAKPLDGFTFDRLKTPLYIVAADILTGEEVVFGYDDTPESAIINSPIADAIRASVSIPVLPEPWHYGGHFLVDGGLVNPLPANVLRDHGADIVIGSSVVRPLRDSYGDRRDKMPNILQTVSNIFSAMESEIIQRQYDKIDILIHHAVAAKHTFDFDQAEALIQAGEEAARQMLPLIKKMTEATVGDDAWR